MLESLSRIQNPLVRCLTAAAATGSALTMAAAVTLGVVAKENPAYRTAVYTALAGTGCGAVLGLLYPARAGQSSAREPEAFSDSLVASQTWKDWRNFVVVRKVQESEEITSFYLQPEDGGVIPNFQPGQFLTIKLNIPGQARPVIRTYSLSDYAEPCEFYRLSIKREPMPAGTDFMPGIASNFMHDQVQVGSIIPAKPPSGKFVLDLQKALPAVLISNGVGITPMISMAKAATIAAPHRPIWFVHGAREGKFHAFRSEMAAVAQQNSNLHLHFVYSRPQSADSKHYHSTGYVDTALIQSLVKQEAEYFLCGSPAFMQSLRAGLKAAGVPESHLFFEAFTSLPAVVPASSVHANGAGNRAEIQFAESGKTATWQSGDGSLLEFAEANELEPPYSCRQGICGTCACRILEGEVAYQTAPVADIDEGSVLICISTPKTSRVVLDL